MSIHFVRTDLVSILKNLVMFPDGPCIEAVIWIFSSLGKNASCSGDGVNGLTSLISYQIPCHRWERLFFLLFYCSSNILLPLCPSDDVYILGLTYIIYISRCLMASGQAVMNESDLATLILNMLIRMSEYYPSRDPDGAIVRPLPRIKRLLSEAICLPHIVQVCSMVCIYTSCLSLNSLKNRYQGIN